jgi:predicted negative regulator of RcsB-dependent stress response
MLLLASCAAPDVSDRSARLDELQSMSQRVELNERQCTDGAVKRSDDAIAKIVTTSSKTTDQQMQAVVDQRLRDLAKCESDADNANEQLSAGERTEYEREAEEAQQRNLMNTAVMSTPH